MTWPFLHLYQTIQHHFFCCTFYSPRHLLCLKYPKSTTRTFVRKSLNLNRPTLSSFNGLRFTKKYLITDLTIDWQNKWVFFFLFSIPLVGNHPSLSLSSSSFSPSALRRISGDFCWASFRFLIPTEIKKISLFFFSISLFLDLGFYVVSMSKGLGWGIKRVTFVWLWDLFTL